MTIINEFVKLNGIEPSEECIKMIEISFPLISQLFSRDDNGHINAPINATIEVFKHESKNQIYILVHWVDKIYTLPLKATAAEELTVDDVIRFIMQDIPEITMYIKQGCYELSIDKNEAALIKHKLNSRKTLDTHRWFKHQFTETTTTTTTNIVFMCFTRLNIFYKNTHYIFTGTKSQLQEAFDKMRQEVDETYKEPYYGRGDHDNLLDTPLDTFCEFKQKCDCCNDADIPNKNYSNSHWYLYSFKTYEKLNEYIQGFKTNPLHNRFMNEIIYI